MVLWGCVDCCQINFMRLIGHNKWFGGKTQLSCIYHVNVHDEYFCNMCFTCVLPLADSSCRGLHTLVHDVLPQKRYVLQETHPFWLMHHFLNGLSIIIFLVCLAIVCYHPAESFYMDLVHAFCACFHTHTNSHNRPCNHVSNHVDDCMNNHFWLVQSLSTYPCSAIFLWIQGSISWPWLTF